jgi:hypothetical protein
VSFALCPDGGPNRTIRWVGPSHMPTEHTVCMLYRETNLLFVNKPLWDTLDRARQLEILRTRSDYVDLVPETPAEAHTTASVWS